MDGELCRSRRLTRSHVAEDRKYRKRLVYRSLSRLVAYIGLAVIGLLAIPAGLLVLLISGIWSATDRIAAYWEQKGGE